MVTRPPKSEEIEAFWQLFQNSFPPPPTYKLFSGEVLEFDREAKTLRTAFSANEDMLNPAGNVQGGILAAFMDDTMGPLAVIMGAGKLFPATTDLHTQYFRPCKPGRFECLARITVMGKTICTTSAELYNVKRDGTRGKLVAAAIQTAALVPFAR